ncbi:hypothetical protein BAS07_16820 [Elizabethkingia anophelis]|nr:hypothetical protein BBD30_01440 [Elizabethkingia anophelis]OPB61441.1 hypothetical protein BAS07_16820 [Elizabethkingia anophelis]
MIDITKSINIMKTIFNNPTFLFYTWFLAIICFYIGIIILRKKNKLLKYFTTELKEREEFQASIRTGMIPEELLDDLEPGSEFLIRRIYVLKSYSKILFYTFLFLAGIMVVRILILKLQ